MRYLAIARFRLLTTIRSSTPIFVIAILPPLFGAIAESVPEPQFLAEAGFLLGRNATVALLMWLIHGAVVLAAGEAFGTLRASRPDLNALPSDLMDSAPVTPRARFWGDAIGVLGATAIIHVCCLPLLAVVAALSPLPIRVFASIEAAILAMMILVSTAAAWKRLAPQTKWSGTRSARSALLFFILLLFMLIGTTRWDAFRDSAYAFFSSPSTRAWEKVTLAVDNPVLLIVLSALLYAVYLGFFYMSATRDRARA